MKNAARPSSGNEAYVFEKTDYLLLFGLMLPLMMTIVNISMLGVALPTVRDTFDIQADLAAWVVTAYSLPFMLFMPLYGRLGDEFGKRWLFLGGIGLFLVGSVLIPSAPVLPILLLGRIIQGIGAAGISPLCMALITQHFPPGTQGKALGTWNSIGPISGIAGPLLAGFIIDFIDWRAIFVPILGLALCSFLVIQRQIAPSHPGISHRRVLQSFDWIGVLLLSLAVTLLMFYLSSRPITGIDALQDWRLLGGAGCAFVGFLSWEKRRNQPFIHFRIFREPHFCIASIGSGIRMTILSSLGFLMPLYLTDIHTLQATTIGLITTLNAATLLLTLRLGGLLADRWHNRWLIMIGATVQTGVIVYFACLPATVPIGWIGAGLAAHGLGAGLALAPLHRTSLSGIEGDQLGMAAGLYSMIRFGVSALGVALAGVLLQNGLDQAVSSGMQLSVLHAYQFVFWCLAAFASTGILLAWNLKK